MYDIETSFIIHTWITNPQFTYERLAPADHGGRRAFMNIQGPQHIKYQHAFVKMTKLLSDVTPLSLSMLAKLSRKGWLDSLHHVVREKHGELVACTTLA